LTVCFGQAGAEYGKPGKDHYIELENEAKLILFPYCFFFFFLTGSCSTFRRLLRRGMWKDGVGGETPTAYKRRHAENVVKPSSAAKLPAQADPKKS
jgi:hypothetical protein